MRAQSIRIVAGVALLLLSSGLCAQAIFDGLAVTGEAFNHGEMEPFTLAVVVQPDGHIKLAGEEMTGTLQSVGVRTLVRLTDKSGRVFEAELVDRSGTLEGRYRRSDWAEGEWRECEFRGFHSFIMEVQFGAHLTQRANTVRAELTLYADRRFTFTAGGMQAQGEMDEDNISFSWETEADDVGEAHLEWTGSRTAAGTYEMDSWEDGETAPVTLTLEEEESDQ